jgi:hypothetical protein
MEVLAYQRKHPQTDPLSLADTAPSNKRRDDSYVGGHTPCEQVAPCLLAKDDPSILNKSGLTYAPRSRKAEAIFQRISIY